MVEEYIRILQEQLPRYGKIRIPTINDNQAKKILAKLKANGLEVKFNDGWFILVKDKPNENTQKSDNNENNKVEQKTERKVEQKPDQKVEQKPEQTSKTEDVEENVRLLSASGSTRICLRARQEIVNAIIGLYNDPNTSSAIRKALLELLKLKGIEIRPESESEQPIDVDELLKVIANDKERK
jgi:hypothetical protein